MPVIYAVIVAAGQGHRMGCDKLRLPWKNHRSILETTVHNWLAVDTFHAIVVVRAPVPFRCYQSTSRDKWITELDSTNRKLVADTQDPVDKHSSVQMLDWYIAPKRVQVVVNPAPSEGMGSSFRVGVQALPHHASAVMLGLADMPELRTDTIALLADTWLNLPQSEQSRAIVAPQYQEQRGHPVMFGAALIPELCRLGGNIGARHLMREKHKDIHLIPVDDPGILVDIDTCCDLDKRL